MCCPAFQVEIIYRTGQSDSRGEGTKKWLPICSSMASFPHLPLLLHLSYSLPLPPSLPPAKKKNGETRTPGPPRPPPAPGSIMFGFHGVVAEGSLRVSAKPVAISEDRPSSQQFSCPLEEKGAMIDLNHAVFRHEACLGAA